MPTPVERFLASPTHTDTDSFIYMYLFVYVLHTGAFMMCKRKSRLARDKPKHQTCQGKRYLTELPHRKVITKPKRKRVRERGSEGRRYQSGRRERHAATSRTRTTNNIHPALHPSQYSPPFLSLLYMYTSNTSTSNTKTHPAAAAAVVCYNISITLRSMEIDPADGRMDVQIQMRFFFLPYNYTSI